MQNKGYYRFPDVREKIVIFVSEDDLWQVLLKGGIARRLTANLSDLSFPKISPDGKWLAYAASEEGYREIFLMNVNGSEQRRITFLGTFSTPLGWSEDSQYIYINSMFEQPFDSSIYKIFINGGEPVKIPVGYANQISFGKTGIVIGRHTRDTARWKRYKGGTAGEIWIDVQNNGDFKKLLNLNSNLICPMWIEDRIYFISDHEGIGNIYSCNLKGKEIKRHTDHNEFYVRNASTDGKTIVYHAGADLFALDIQKNKYQKIKINYFSSHTQTNRKFIEPTKYLQGYDLHPKGTYTAVAIRGKVASFANWSGPVKQWGKKDGIRYRMPTWLYDNKHLVSTTDEIDGEDRILMMDIEKNTEDVLKKFKVGRVHGIFPCPKENKVMITNHRNELILLDCDKKTSKILDISDYHRIGSVGWSPDGKWITYDFLNTMETSIIKVAEISSAKVYEVTKAFRYDFSPIFSPDGKYIYFIGDRTFYPVYDSMQFELSFIKSAKLYAIPLKKEIKSPFILEPKSPAGDEKEDKKKKEDKKDKKEEIKVEIEFENIIKRMIEFPINAGMYDSLEAFEKKVFYLEYPRDCLKKDDNQWWSEPKPRQIIKMYDFEKMQEDTLIKDISSFKLSLIGSNMIVRKAGELSIYKTGEKPKEKVKKKYSVEGGAIEMSR
ncbi:MAG: PD40 domain-containing protein, partial [Candidatus Cloacimonetes bacterium]|nr:PD40 domain-containing protein [Candidatus Cloacimonadota bacterium]